MTHAQTRPVLSVWYDGDCPVCRQEVKLYRRIDKDHHIEWIDITALADSNLPSGKSRQDLLGRFHARQGNGSWHIGVDAFAAIWRRLPVFKYFGFLFRLPVIRQMAQVAYLGFLKWQRHHRARRQAGERLRQASDHREQARAGGSHGAPHPVADPRHRRGETGPAAAEQPAVAGSPRPADQ